MSVANISAAALITRATTNNNCYHRTFQSRFSASTPLVGWQKGYPACKRISQQQSPNAVLWRDLGGIGSNLEWSREV